VFSGDESLNDVGRRQVNEIAKLDVPSMARRLAAPERRVGQTAQLRGLRVITEPRLADLDCGQLQGKTLEDVRPEDLRVWLTDPAQVPHGGESISALIGRVQGWLASLAEHTLATVAVTHPAVIRAAIVSALGAPAKSFWRLDISPASRTTMHFRRGSWTLRW